MKILVLNAGSSSLKYQLFDMEKETILAKGLCERIGTGGAVTHKPTGKDPVSEEIALPDHGAALERVLALLTDATHGVVASIEEIDGGLIALTRFQGEIGFYPDEYLEIIRTYLGK